MSKPKICERCEGTGWVECCPPGSHMCRGEVTCHVCQGAGKLIEVKKYEPYFESELPKDSK